MQESLTGHQGRAAIAHRRAQTEDVAGEHLRLEDKLREGRRRLLLRGCGRDGRRRYLPLSLAGITLRDEGAAEHQSRANCLQHSEFLVQHQHRQHHRERHLQLDDRGGQVHAHQLVGLIVAVATNDEMHDALACQPGERRHREHHELVQLAKCDSHDQERKSADRHGQRHTLQHAASHHTPAHRHVVQRKGERAKSGIKNPEQGLLPRRLVVFLVCLQCLRHTVDGCTS